MRCVCECADVSVCSSVCSYVWAMCVRSIHMHNVVEHMRVYVCWTSVEAKLHCDMQLYHQLVVQPLRVRFGRSGSRARSCRINNFSVVFFLLSLSGEFKSKTAIQDKTTWGTRTIKKPLHTQSYMYTHTCMLTYSNEQQRADSNNNHE